MASYTANFFVNTKIEAMSTNEPKSNKRLTLQLAGTTMKRMCGGEGRTYPAPAKLKAVEYSQNYALAERQ